jgi:hypothetical protein
MTALSGRPLADTAVDRRLYAPRREHGVLRKSAEQRLNVLLAGPRGSGKTTLLRQTLLDLREDDRPGAFIDGKLAPDAFSFLQLVRFQLGDAPNLPQAVRERYAQAFSPRPNLGEAGRLLDLIEAMKDPSEEPEQTTLFVDGLPSPDVGHALFGRLRDELWQLPFNWIVAVDDRERAALMEPPADAFFDRLVNLGPMSSAEQVALLEKRVTVTSRTALQPLTQASEGNPRLLLALARDAVEGGEAIDDLLAGRARRETVASSLSRPAAMLLTELESLGAASASDEELLKRLGWTRPRATQVFAELERAGLVTSREEKGHGGGRPRKIYLPNRKFGDA